MQTIPWGRHHCWRLRKKYVERAVAGGRDQDEARHDVDVVPSREHKAIAEHERKLKQRRRTDSIRRPRLR
jgi:hypothetical protein